MTIATGILCPNCGTEMVGQGVVLEVDTPAGGKEQVGPSKRRCPECHYIEDHDSGVIRDAVEGRR